MLSAGITTPFARMFQAISRFFQLLIQTAAKSVLDAVIGFDSKSLQESLADERRAVHANARNADAMIALVEKRKPMFNQS